MPRRSRSPPSSVTCCRRGCPLPRPRRLPSSTTPPGSRCAVARGLLKARRCWCSAPRAGLVTPRCSLPARWGRACSAASRGQSGPRRCAPPAPTRSSTCRERVCESACVPSDRGASMAKLTVSVAGVDYDRTRALFDGTVPIAGCETICCAMSPEEAFHRAFHYQEFDITELSLSNSMALIAKGANAYVAIPVFPSRLFRHSSIYIRTDRGIECPEDLRGKVIGVPEYAMTAAVWIRGILQDEYGVRAADVKWRSGGLEQPGREARVAL